MTLRTRWPWIILGLMVVLYIAYFGWFTLRAFDLFVYQAHDLGIYDQAVWNTVHGRPFRSTLEEPYDTLLGDHFEPIVLLLALPYALWPSPKTLLLIQSAALGLGALPVYWLAREGLASALEGRRTTGEGPAGEERPSTSLVVEVAALAFAAVYLLYPAVHSANVFEFHPSALAIPLLLYSIYFLRKRRFALYFLFLILTMSTKEVLPLTTFVLGLYAFFVERVRMVGLATMVASALWFGVAVFVVIPHFSPEDSSQYFALYYGWLGESPGEVVSGLITHPELVWQRLVRPDSLLYVNRLLLPVMYLALLGLPMLLLATPALLLNVLSDFSFQHLSLNFFQYAAAIAPFVIVAAIDGVSFLVRHGGPWLERIWSAGGRLAAGRTAGSVLLGTAMGAMLLASLAVQRYHGYLPFSRDYYLTPVTDKVTAAEALVPQIPRQSVVSTDRILGPHLSQREDLYLYPSLHDAEYVVVDTSYRDTPFPPRDRYDAIQAMLGSGEYGVVDGRYGFLLLQRGLEQPAVPDHFYDFTRAAQPAAQVRTDLVFGEELRLIGFDLVWERPVRPHAHLVLYWQALRPVDRDLRLFFILTDPSGEVLPGTELEFDASVWHPPSHWSGSEVVRTETLHWSVEQPGRFGVAIGVVEGPGFWETDRRLQPVVHSAPWAMPQVHDGSLVWLVTLETDGRFATMEKPGGVP
jgi:uncharacterized membrane protein